MSQIFCEATTGKCKDTEKIWGITKNGKLYRLTFSKSLAYHIKEQNNEYEIKQYRFIIGKKLEKNQTSESGLYALMSKKGDYALRISLIKGVAKLHSDDNTRYLAQAWLLAD